jgi:hypothetical protein
MLGYQRCEIMTYRYESIHMAIDRAEGGRMLTTGWA